MNAQTSSFSAFLFSSHSLSLSLSVPSSLHYFFHQSLVCHAAGAPNLSRVRVRGHCDSEHSSVSSIMLSLSLTISLSLSCRICEEDWWKHSVYVTFTIPNEGPGYFVSITLKISRMLSLLAEGTWEPEPNDGVGFTLHVWRDRFRHLGFTVVLLQMWGCGGKEGGLCLWYLWCACLCVWLKWMRYWVSHLFSALWFQIEFEGSCGRVRVLALKATSITIGDGAIDFKITLHADVWHIGAGLILTNSNLQWLRYDVFGIV